MKIAVTNHAVQRYQERVEGAREFDSESVRRLVRDLVKEGFRTGAVRPHPHISERRIIPFTSGKSVLYLSVGPNTTTFKADLSVIGVLFEREVTGGKQGMGVTLGDVVQRTPTEPQQRPLFIATISGDGYFYKIQNENELLVFLEEESKRGVVSVYRLTDEHESS